MSFFDDLFGSEEEVRQEVMQPEWQKDIGPLLKKRMKPALEQYQPGKEYESLSQMMKPAELEKLGLGKLEDWLGQPAPESIGAAAGEVKRTLSGDTYDPTEGEYYKATRKNITRERKEALDRINRQAAKYGLNRSSWRTAEQSDLEEKTLNNISQLLGKLTLQERQTRAGMVPQALNVARAEEAQPLQRVQAAMKYGDLPRLLESVGYKDFLRKQQEGQIPLNTLMNLWGKNLPYGVKSMPYEKTGALSSIMPLVSDISGGVGDYSLMEEMVPLAFSAGASGSSKRFKKNIREW